MPFKNRLRKNDVNFCLHAIVWPFCVRYLSNIEKKKPTFLIFFWHSGSTTSYGIIQSIDL